MTCAWPRSRDAARCATRKPRDGEENGIHYHFVEPEEFLRMVNAGEFLEHAMYNNNNYGTSREALRVEMEERGRDVLLEIEVQGARQVREHRPDARFIFLLPPSFETLRRRLAGRGTDAAAEVDHAPAEADSPEPADGARYRRIAADIRGILDDHQVCGMHVHLGYDDPEQRVEALAHHPRIGAQPTVLRLQLRPASFVPAYRGYRMIFF